MKEELKTKVFQALGEVSMCWNPMPSNQVFDSTKALSIGENIWKEIEKVLNEKIRPMLQRDGGDVKLVEVTPEGIVKVKLLLACAGCPMAQMTLKNGIEKVLKESVPEVKSVMAV